MQIRESVECWIAFLAHLGWEWDHGDDQLLNTGSICVGWEDGVGVVSVTESGGDVGIWSLGKGGWDG